MGNLSYAGAVKEVESGKGENAGWGEIVNKKKKQEDEKRKWVKKLVTFIAGVINAKSGIKSKTKRIQVIVKAAIHERIEVGGSKR